MTRDEIITYRNRIVDIQMDMEARMGEIVEPGQRARFGAVTGMLKGAGRMLERFAGFMNVPVEVKPTDFTPASGEVVATEPSAEAQAAVAAEPTVTPAVETQETVATA